MYRVDFNYKGHIANTLEPDDLGTHQAPDGWTVEGEVHEDWYEWVNDFTATKGKMKVWGNFEKSVYATSKRAYDDFIKYHEPKEWDYWDI